MGDEIKQAFARSRLVDITTTGRKTGEARRIEIPYLPIDGRIYITGHANDPRGWYANLLAKPEFTIHLKNSYNVDLPDWAKATLDYSKTVEADVPARATPIRDPEERHRILSSVLAEIPEAGYDLAEWVAGSPLVEIEILD